MGLKENDSLSRCWAFSLREISYVVFCTCWRSSPLANDAKIVRSRKAQCNAEESLAQKELKVVRV